MRVKPKMILTLLLDFDLAVDEFVARFVRNQKNTSADCDFDLNFEVERDLGGVTSIDSYESENFEKNQNQQEFRTDFGWKYLVYVRAFRHEEVVFQLILEE